jgi:hypothetical protein
VIVVVLVIVVLVLVVVIVVVVLVVLLRYFHLHGKRTKVHGSSWYIYVYWPSCLCLVYMWLLAIVPTFLAGFGNLPVQGRCCQNFQWILTYCLFM